MLTSAEPSAAAAPTWPPDAYDADGVDVTLIHEMLQLTPLERLEALRGFARGLVELADAARPA